MEIRFSDPFPLGEGDLQKHKFHFEDNARVTVIDGQHKGRSGKLEGINAHGGHLVRLDSGDLVEYHHSELEPEGFGTYSRTASNEKRGAFGRDPVGGLVRALEADRVSVPDRVQISSLLEKIRTGAYAIHPLGFVDDRPDYGSPHYMLKIFAEKYASGDAPASGVLAKKADAHLDDSLPVGEKLARRRKIDPAKVAVGMKVLGCDGVIGTITKVRGASVNIDYPNGSGVCLIEHIEAA